MRFARGFRAMPWLNPYNPLRPTGFLQFWNHLNQLEFVSVSFFPGCMGEQQFCKAKL
jgi:hypothetical protein